MKTLLKRIPTNTAGVFYKEIISKNDKVVDKVFLIRYTDKNNKQRLKTVGKRSDGISEAYCKSKLTFDDLAEKYFIKVKIEIKSKSLSLKCSFEPVSTKSLFFYINSINSSIVLSIYTTTFNIYKNVQQYN